jgi:hypothetical protein
MRCPGVGYGGAVDDNPREPGRIASFATALGVFGTTAVGVLVTGRREGRLPDHYRAADLAVGALATQKFTRLLAKDSVTTPLPAPTGGQPRARSLVAREANTIAEPSGAPGPG